MHPRNPYTVPPDFSALAQAYPSLQRHLLQTASGVTIDFHDELAQRTLTKALLHRDFQLDLSIPGDRLCPPVPNRLNYVLWLQDIVQATTRSEDGPILGIDIGTGASAIYPLLFCRVAPDSAFVATELDERSFMSSQDNVARNQLLQRVQVLRVAADGPLLSPLIDAQTRFTFTMCNPPFYTSLEDIAQSAEHKELPPSAVCTGAEVEMITDGGEATFVRRMVQESLTHREQCQWYTSMLGKLSSVIGIVQLLRDKRINNYGVTEFVQGQTRRWAVAWSFQDFRLPDTTGRISTTTLRSFMPARTSLREPLPAKPVLQSLRALVESIAGASVTEAIADPPALVCHFTANTWTRAARRKQSAAPIHDNKRPILVARIRVSEEDASSVLEFTWLRGHDSAAFESFSSHVGRKMRSTMITST